MKVLVTGAGGMLAGALLSELKRRRHAVTMLARTDLDVTDAYAVSSRVRSGRPDAVIHCAAYTRVDDAEQNVHTAFRVNRDGTAHVARACLAAGARLLYPSTDYVFAGASPTPYLPEDRTGPLNVYGASKLAGESAALSVPDGLVVRTSWLYGGEGRSFVGAIAEAAREGARLRVVRDQVGRPTRVDRLARTLLDLLEGGARGIFHATGGGPPVSRFEFARVIVAETGVECDVEPVTSPEVPRPARRPANSVLDCTATEKLLGRSMEDWRAEWLNCPTQIRFRST